MYNNIIINLAGDSMAEKEILISVIIPVYNVENYIRKCLDSIVGQTIAKDNLQVILINDGSTDGSAEICAEYCEKYDYFELYNIKNGGQARARNIALDFVKGKYIAYLDSDDELSSNTLESTSRFFDKHYDEIDLVTYKIVPVFKGIRKKTHYRYNILKKTGVYDLTQPENYYITQTNMNIVVKNKGDENILFDTTPNYRHEDQLYCTDILRDKMKIGFVDDCEYLYEQNPQGTVSKFFSTITFDITMMKWKELFDSFGENLPPYVQALYVNDIQWKLKTDIFHPYHLEGKEYEIAMSDIRYLLNKIDDDVILNHPDCNEMSKYYFIDMKYNSQLTVSFDDNIRLLNGDNVVSETPTVNLKVTKFRFFDDTLEICGHLSSFAFNYCDKPNLIVRKNGTSVEYPELYESSFSYDAAKVKNNQAWGFRCLIDTKEKISVSFKVEIGSKNYSVEIDTGEWVVLNKSIGRNEYVTGNKKCRMTDNRFIIENVDAKEERKYQIKTLLRMLKTNIKVFVVRLICLLLPIKDKIWLYHDCNTVGTDNAYLQFVHDFEKKDNVKRYYVVNGSIEKAKALFTPEQQKYLVTFRSWKHKILYLKASKVITAFIEKVNYLPFFDDVYKYYIDLFKGEVIYLQHGVLHAHLPWKYSYERLDLAAEVISTNYEIDNFTRNYCFPESVLIKAKMPRYDFIDCDVTPDKNRILLAPSWRKYLIELKGDGTWVPTREKFLQSEFYIETRKFLESDALKELLEANDWYLDFKLHPIFAVYNDCFNIDNPRITVPAKTEPSDYKIVITDYSSFVFDFVYLKRAVVYFMPDYAQFKAGFNDYKELDIPLEKGFGELTKNADELLAALDKIIKNDGKALPPFDKKTDGFFLNQDKNSRAEIYSHLIN